jgi:hypothetical protein
MEKKWPLVLPEIIFSSSDPGESRQLQRLVKAGRVRKLAPRVFSSNLTDAPEVIIRRNLFMILGRLYPGALLSHRSALAFEPTPSGQLFITYRYSKKIALPGVTLHVLHGPGPIEGDRPLSGELYAAQLERALLENLQPGRKRGAFSKTVEQAVLEERLEQYARVHGESGLNELRDKARQIAERLDMQPEFEKLNRLIGAMLDTRPSRILSSPLALARALGDPYDPARLTLFEKLFVELNRGPFVDIPDHNTGTAQWTAFAFFEAYFSNYIEGTVFALADAARVIQTGAPMPSRDEDSHDILGTYKLVSDRREMQTTPADPSSLIDILKHRHAILLGGRASKQPGRFKEHNNRAGETHFVDYTLVRGTLIKGFDFYKALAHPFAKAAYMMFLVSEVHPFADGNGRLARIMMNAELVHRGQSRIIIPTVYRDDYLGALRRLSRHGDPAAYVRMLQRAHQFSASITGEDMAQMQVRLEAASAFSEPEDGRLGFL